MHGERLGPASFMQRPWVTPAVVSWAYLVGVVQMLCILAPLRDALTRRAPGGYSVLELFAGWMLLGSVGLTLGAVVQRSRRTDLLWFALLSLLVAATLLACQHGGPLWAVPMSFLGAATAYATWRAVPKQASAPPAGPRRLFLPDVALSLLWVVYLGGWTASAASPAVRQWAEANGHTPLGLALNVAIAVLLGAVWVWLFVDCVRNKRLDRQTRLLWVLALLIGWLPGMSAYYALVKRPAMVACPHPEAEG